MRSERGSGLSTDLGIRLVILTLAVLLLMAMQRTGQLRPIQNFVARLTSPSQASAAGLTNGMTQMVEAVAGFRGTQRRLAELERINNSLVVENLRLREVERENERLREQLNFAQTRPSFELRGGQIIARVIGRDPGNFLDYIILDLGRNHGIAAGMPVLSNEGLVGRIAEVTDATSKVLLITDQQSSVSTILQSSRLNGQVQGQPGGGLLMQFISQGESFSVGEIVLTSGLGSNFPKGIAVGQVVEILQRDFEETQQAIIRPTVNFSRLESVLVVTNFDPLENVPDLDLPAEGGDEAERTP